MNAKITGQLGEEIAINYLQASGYKIIGSNFQTRNGEIDIIAKDKDKTVVFVEVRLRASIYFGQPEETVSLTKQKKIISCAETFLQKYKKLPTCRFDVIGLTKNPLSQKILLRHTKNAFLDQF